MKYENHHPNESHFPFMEDFSIRVGDTLSVEEIREAADTFSNIADGVLAKYPDDIDKSTSLLPSMATEGISLGNFWGDITIELARGRGINEDLSEQTKTKLRIDHHTENGTIQWVYEFDGNKVVRRDLGNFTERSKRLLGIDDGEENLRGYFLGGLGGAAVGNSEYNKNLENEKANNELNKELGFNNQPVSYEEIMGLKAFIDGQLWHPDKSPRGFIVPEGFFPSDDLDS